MTDQAHGQRRTPAAPGEILELFKGGYLSVAEAIDALEPAFASRSAGQSDNAKDPCRDVLTRLVALNDHFWTKTDRNQADAYYTMISGKDGLWQEAKDAIATPHIPVECDK